MIRAPGAVRAAPSAARAQLLLTGSSSRRGALVAPAREPFAGAWLESGPRLDPDLRDRDGPSAMALAAERAA